MGNLAFGNGNECLRKSIDILFEKEIVDYQLIQLVITVKSLNNKLICLLSKAQTNILTIEHFWKMQMR